MSGMSSIGVSALNAAQAGLITTGNNIANASTPGYNRELTVQSEIPGLGTSNGFIGQGVNVTTVQRAYNSFVTAQLQQQQSQSSQLNTYYNQIQQINNVIADPAAGLTPALQNFFSAINSVANAPASSAARQTLLSNGQALAGTFGSLNQVLSGLATGVNGQITSSVSNINSEAQQIAALNQSISSASANSNGQPPNALLDQRDALIQKLSQETQVTVLQQSNGSVNLYVGSGQPLVVNNQALSLTTFTSASNPGQLAIGLSSGSTAVTPIPNSALQGGNLGGLIAFRDQTLTPIQNQLGLLAVGLGTTINNQQALGQNLSGQLGSPFFTVATPVVSANSNNTGTASVSASLTNVSQLTGSNYQLSYNGTQYSLTRLSDNTTTTSATLPMTVDGVTLNLTGTPHAGDSFLIQPTINGAQNLAVALASTNQIAAAVPVVASSGTANIGTGSLSAPSVNPGLPVNAHLQDQVTLTFTSPTTYNAVDTTTATTLASGVSYTAGASLSYNGWTATLTGTPQTNDTFSVGANTNATTDGNNALAMAGLQSSPVLIGGTQTFAGVYSQMVSQIGAKTNQLNVTSTAQTNLLNQTTQTQQSVSGVNLNEEAANLIQYQQAYQAAGKAIQIADSMFTSILGMLN